MVQRVSIPIRLRNTSWLISRTARSDDDLTEEEKKYDSIYLNQSTYNAALLSAGSAIETTLAVASGQVKNAFAVIRPPGHHAETDRCMGFCHFDNVAIAAKVAQERVPGIDKILIVDWDVHHGNGIQQAFYEDPNVLYISVHVHEDGRFYPSGDYGDHLHCGHGNGIGKNINIPWSNKGMGDADYLYAFQHVVMPVAYDFNPDLILIASGFDAARGDQLGGCFVSPECYAHMTHMLMSLAEGKVVACLEGGYNLDSISLSALAVTKTLMGEAPPRIHETAATKTGVENVRKVIMHQSQFWRCLHPKDVSREFDDFVEAARLHDIIREHQSTVLFNNHQMVNLYVFRPKISKSFEKQVLATRNYRAASHLLVIFHDPPEVAGSVDALTGKIDLHGMTSFDAINSYIAWAVKRKFGVVDVNIPKFLTGISDTHGLEDDETIKISKATKELAVYLWENYLEACEARKVVFLGAGEAYKGILEILNTRTWDNVGKFAGAAGCIDEQTTLRPCSEQFMTDFARTYFRSTSLFVSHEHPAWDASRKKFSKKWGRLARSPYKGLSKMLVEHRAEIRAFLLERAGLPADEPETVVDERRVDEAVRAALGNADRVKAEMNGNGDDMGDTIRVAGGVPADEL